MIEYIFNELIQYNYRKHEKIQRNEDARLHRKSLQLNQIDELAEAFEQKMDQAAHGMEQWLIKHKKER